jgi:hypothetical protein
MGSQQYYDDDDDDDDDEHLLRAIDPDLIAAIKRDIEREHPRWSRRKKHRELIRRRE